MKNNNNPQKLQPLVSLSYLEFLLGIKRNKLRELANTAGRFYKPYDLHKNGTNKWRHIDNPQNPLKSIQKRILKKILNQGLHYLPDGMMGGISGRSIVENAKIHVGKECMGIIDIKDCFPNTNHLRIYQIWKNYFGCGVKTISILTQLTTFQQRLPQGAPTSPLLCNFALASVYKKIEEITKRIGLNLSIFIDDITISGKKELVTEAIQPIIKILAENKYAVRRRKVRIINSGYGQKVTGITINKKLSANRKRIREMRNLIFETAKLKEYIPSSKYNKIHGMISFAKQVSETQGDKLKKLADALLIKPIIQARGENGDERRSCSRFSNDHSFMDL